MQTMLQPTADFYAEKRQSRGVMSVAHYHHTFELYYIEYGERDYFIEDKFYKVKERDVVLVPVGALHRTGGKNSQRVLVNFTGRFLRRYFTEEMIESLNLNVPTVFHSDAASPSLRYFFEELYKIYQSESETDESRIAGLLFNILFIMSRERNSYEKQEYEDERMENIVRYVNENYASIDGLEELASHFYISKYHFCRLFKKNLGVSVTSYVNKIKIREASRLLESRDLSLTEIATASGFNSLSYFCKVFKSEMGISPSAYKSGAKARTGSEN